ncbi:hypothetical protein ISN45_Aa05g013440 [Arabidopsis thaliana x Arabidopsis arenosa]|uniref:Transmembrane protein n=1 Tax=Arabidopsis thaliana x Arabidopsis arenosa TaxID=1240361 RepID=A0A8T1ZNC5_9BRAS|nr:hypothetical protein ISN45_Aa05g013440 [Arabidopsis thaliana x Arabidopsis arenosa]
MEMESRTSGSGGISFWSILLHSLWTTITGILFFRLATTNGHKSGFIHFFAISGTILITLPWIIQLLISTTVILLHKTKGYNLMWIVQSPTISKKVVDHTKSGTCSVSSSPSSNRQVLKESDAEEIAIRIVIGAADGKRDGSSAAPLGMLMEIEGRNKTKLLTNGSA